jgi:succinoglycan biosynthesis protein ExoV
LTNQIDIVREAAPLQIYYYKDSVGNFGDDLNPWLWPQLFPKPLELCFDDRTLFIGIGSILNQKIPAHPEKKIVFGSGFGYGTPPAITESWRFFCVRGPLTARALGLPENIAISDSALLLRELIEPAWTAKYDAAFMPHHITAHYDDWRHVCESLSICYIDPRAPVTGTIDAIRKSSVLITESLHGAIVADAFRVPWIPVRTRPRILEFKWQDWSRSLALEHSFEWLAPIWNRNIDSRLKGILHPFASSLAHDRLRWLIRFGRRRLSSETEFQQVYRRLVDAFRTLVEDAI